MFIKTIIFASLCLASNYSMSQIDSSSFLENAFRHATNMKTALLSNDIQVLYDFLKTESKELPPFEKFKKETLYVYHDENYEYDSGISNIILEKPLVYSYKDSMLQCVIKRKTILKSSDEVIFTDMWYYSADGKTLKYENLSVSSINSKLLELFPFVDLKLFDNK